MRVPINLASQPFRRDRPMIIGSVALSIVLVGLLCVLVTLALIDRGRAADTNKSIAQIQRKLSSVAAEQGRLEAVLRKPENAEVLERSVFLNTLLQRKGISWTRIFADLEKVMPYNVRIISIRPEVNAQNQIRLEMNVGAESTEPVIEMLKRLESSEMFGATYVHTSLPPSQSEPLFRFRVSVNYAQSL
jgi:Tfp pilus assembly protein PilN